MKKTITLLTTLLILTGITTAADINLKPGEQKQVTNNTTNYQSASSNLSLTFQQNQTGIYTTAPQDYSPTKGEITLKYQNRTETKTVKVESVSNWTVEKTTSKDNISVGNTGQLLTYNLTQTGNTDEEITVQTTGNISNYLVFDQKITARKGIEKTISIDYQVPSDTPFGNYNGSINFTASTLNQSFTVKTQFKDGIDPGIQNISTPDLMATEKPVFKITATDNLNVKSVNADIRKKNQSGNNYLDFKKDINFQPKNNSDQWTYKLTETDQRGKYRINFTVFDEAGNKVSGNSSYEISRLNATKVTNDNFRFDPIWSEGEISQSFLLNFQEVNSELTLVSQDIPENSGVKFKVLLPGDEQPTPIELNQPLKIEDEGEYKLFVESEDYQFNSTKEYSGRLNISVPEEHIDVPDVVFGGELKTDNDPKPRSLSLGQFRGRLTYLESANTTRISNLLSEIEGSDEGLAVYIGAVNRQNCQGSTEWSDESCADLSIGELEDVKQSMNETNAEIEQVRDNRSSHWLYLTVGGFLISAVNILYFTVKAYQRKNVIYPVWRTKRQK